jgi:hypothetical protein
MKRFIIFMLALVVVLMFVFAVFIAPAPRAKMSIRAIGPTGASFSNPPALVWSFAITNKGPSAVSYRGEVGVVNERESPFLLTPKPIQPPEGILAPGQGVVTNILVPAGPGIMWCADLLYTPVESSFRRTMRESSMNVPVLGRFV